LNAYDNNVYLVGLTTYTIHTNKRIQDIIPNEEKTKAQGLLHSKLIFFLQDTHFISYIHINVYWILMCLWNLSGMKVCITSCDKELYPYILFILDTHPHDVDIIRPCYAILSNFYLLGIDCNEVQCRIIQDFIPALEKLYMHSPSVVNVLCSCVITFLQQQDKESANTTLLSSYFPNTTIFLLLKILNHQEKNMKNVQILSILLTLFLQETKNIKYEQTEHDIQLCLRLIQFYQTDEKTFYVISMLLKYILKSKTTILDRGDDNLNNDKWKENVCIILLSYVQEKKTCYIVVTEILCILHIPTILLITYSEYTETVIDILNTLLIFENKNSVENIYLLQLIFDFTQDILSTCCVLHTSCHIQHIQKINHSVMFDLQTISNNNM
jgi:hypothetical protein